MGRGLLFFLLAFSPCSGQLFEFVGNQQSNVLAILELSSLPAQPGEFVSLTFTPSGDELFGFGEQYVGEFDTMVFDHGQFVDDGFCGLGALDKFGGEFATMESNNPPISRIWNDIDEFEIGVSSFESFDFLRLIINSEVAFSVEGDWRLVPEPSTHLVLGFVMLWGLHLRWRRPTCED